MNPQVFSFTHSHWSTLVAITMLACSPKEPPDAPRDKVPDAGWSGPTDVQSDAVASSAYAPPVASVPYQSTVPDPCGLKRCGSGKGCCHNPQATQRNAWSLDFLVSCLPPGELDAPLDATCEAHACVGINDVSCTFDGCRLSDGNCGVWVDVVSTSLSDELIELNVGCVDERWLGSRNPTGIPPDPTLDCSMEDVPDPCDLAACERGKGCCHNPDAQIVNAPSSDFLTACLPVGEMNAPIDDECSQHRCLGQSCTFQGCRMANGNCGVWLDEYDRVTGADEKRVEHITLDLGCVDEAWLASRNPTGVPPDPTLVCSLEDASVN